MVVRANMAVTERNPCHRPAPGDSLRVRCSITALQYTGRGFTSSSQGIRNVTVGAGHRYVCPEKPIYGRRSSSSFSFHRGSTPGCVGALGSTSGRENGSVSSTFSPFPEDVGWPGCFCVGGVDGCVPAFRAPFCPCCFCPDGLAEGDGNPPFCCCFCPDGLLFLEEDGPRVCAPDVLPFFDPDASVESTMVGPPCPLRCKGGDSSFDRRSRSL